VNAGVGKGRSTGQTLCEQGTESRRDLSAWGVGRGRHEGEVLLVRAGQITKDHKLAGLPEVTPVRVTDGARLFVCSAAGHERPAEKGGEVL
jgi:hypothetical protein